MEFPAAYGSTVFCDDIRHEDGGKLTYVGVYPNALIVHSQFPAVLPKFGLAINYKERDGRCSSDVVFQIYLPGDDPDKPFLSGQLLAAERRRGIERPPADPDYPPEDPTIKVTAPILLAPLILQKRGFIKVRATVDGDVIKLGSLKIDQKLPPSEDSSP